MKDRWGAKSLGKPYRFWQSGQVVATLDALIDKKIGFETARKRLDVSYDSLAWRVRNRRKQRGDIMALIAEREEEVNDDE